MGHVCEADQQDSTPPIIPSKVCGMVNNNDAFTCPGHNSSNLDQRNTNLKFPESKIKQLICRLINICADVVLEDIFPVVLIWANYKIEMREMFRKRDVFLQFESRIIQLISGLIRHISI